MNIFILYKLIQQMRKLIHSNPDDEEGLVFKGAGCLFWLFQKAFKGIDRHVSYLSSVDIYLYMGEKNLC